MLQNMEVKHDLTYISLSLVVIRKTNGLWKQPNNIFALSVVLELKVKNWAQF